LGGAQGGGVLASATVAWEDPAVLVVHRGALWVLIGICCVPAVTAWLTAGVHSFRRGHGRVREAPLAFAGMCVDRLMVGVGTGLAAATVVFLLASLWVQLT
jgi:hypothetical protein